MPANRIIIARHDETDIGSGCIQGHIDTELAEGADIRIGTLTDLIVKQEGLQYLQKEKIYVMSSDLGRTYLTAETIRRQLLDNYKLKSDFRYTKDLKERDMGWDLSGSFFEDALPILSPGSKSTPDAETIYSLLYSSNKIPGGEAQKTVRDRLERFITENMQTLQGGVVIVVGHLISDMNYLQNLLRYGNILGGDPPQEYQHYHNLQVVRLKLDQGNFMRYKFDTSYGPPDINGVGADKPPLAKTLKD